VLARAAGRIATDELLPVESAPFDLRQPTLLGSQVRGLSAAFTEPARDSAQKPQLDGYDDCFLVNRAGTGTGRLALCVCVRAQQTRRVIEV
jgi:hypothetical protein